MATLLEQCSLLMVPSGYKAGSLYSVIPDSADGTFTFSRNSTATRTNSAGLIEEMAIDVPRLQYPSCPSLLLEPARTNEFTYSEDFTQGIWSKQNQFSVTKDVVNAPDGTVTGNLFVPDTTVGIHNCYVSKPNTVVKTMSVFFKRVSGSIWQNIGLRSPTSSTLEVQFDIDNLTVFGTPNVASWSIEQFPDDWYKVTATMSIVGTGSSNFIVDAVDTNGDRSVAGNDVDGYYIWGSQLEEGTYPTTYIPTQAATVDRALDVCSIDDLIVNGILSQAEGTTQWKHDNVSYVSRYTTDGNREDFIDGVSQGSVVAAVPTSFDITAPSKTEQISMYPTPLTDDEILNLN